MALDLKILKWHEGHLTVESVIAIRRHLNEARVAMEGRVLVLPEGCGVYMHQYAERIYGFEIQTSRSLEPNTFKVFHRVEFKFE